MAKRMQGVTYTVEDGFATIELGRERGNAIDASLVAGLQEAFGSADRDPEVRGVLLAARGKLFCPGLDLVELVDADREKMDAFMQRFGACLLQMYTFPKPVVAALHGHALAGGLILALTADWRVASREAMVGLNELKVGLPLPFGVTMMLRDATAGPRLEEVALFGRNYRGDEALGSGLVHDAVDRTAVRDTALERLDEMTSKDARAFEVTKRYLRSATVERIRALDASLRAEFLDCWFADETRARIRELVDALRARKK